MSTEAWLSGPIPGVPGLLMPVAHSLVQAKSDLRAAAADLTDAELWERPGGAAAIGFHLRHIAGSADRLLSYALGRSLSEAQLTALRREKEPGDPHPRAVQLIDGIDAVLDRVLETVRRTSETELTAPRSVGRARLPSTLIGLLFHIAEHTQRHTGQVVTTARIIRGTSARGA